MQIRIGIEKVRTKLLVQGKMEKKSDIGLEGKLMKL
jgi:hypothetical protein